jgi:hypothetical protein
MAHVRKRVGALVHCVLPVRASEGGSRSGHQPLLAAENNLRGSEIVRPVMTCGQLPSGSGAGGLRHQCLL